MKKTDIQPGDYVTLSPKNGLGRGKFLVIEFDEQDAIHQLYVEDRAGIRWIARASGAKIVR